MAYKQLKLWFDDSLARRLAKEIKVIDNRFDAKSFCDRIDKGIPSLELKDRIALFAQALAQNLPVQYPEQLKILSQIIGRPNPKEVDMFKEYYWLLPLAKFVEDYGLANFKISTDFIKEITQRSTGEYAIRPYIEKYPDKSHRLLLKWAKDPSFHVRRLATEGIRLRLPWAKKGIAFANRPEEILQILDMLKDDPSKYVQKSVANNLNDLIKDHQTITIQTIKSWTKNAGKERQWIIKHAIRNLRKAKDPLETEIMGLL